MVRKPYYSCDDHIEYVIEDFISEYESTPNLELDMPGCSNYCNYCNNYAIYVITNIN